MLSKVIAKKLFQSLIMEGDNMKKNQFALIISIPTIFLLIVTLMFAGCVKNELPPKPYVAPQNVKIQLSSDIVFLTVTELAQKIRSGELTSLEVVDAFLSQIYEYNPKLNAIITVDNKNARERAKAADKALAKGQIWGPLHGVPVTIKDCYATKGLKTTSAYPPLADYTPEFDATVVARLKNAGAIILGKTNMPVLAMDYQTNNPIFGKTNNPWDLERTPGGSTGGGAAAVAAGLSPLEMGSDGGGSIRIPSHFCGIFGLKPTENMVSGAGSIPGLPKREFNSMRHLVSWGPLTRSIDDLKLVFPIIAGADYKDVNVPAIPIVYPEPRPLKTLRIAWTDHFPGAKVSNDTMAAMKTLVEKLTAKGITIEKINPPGFDFNNAWKTWRNLNDMEVGIYIPSYIRLMLYIFRLKEDMIFPFSYEKHLKVLTKRDSLISKMEEFLSNYDAWLCPVAITPAYKHIIPERWSGPYPVYNEDIVVDGESIKYQTANGAYTTILNITGNPVVVMPIGYTRSGIPIGVQVIGSRWQDARLLTVAEQLFKVGGDFKHPPGYKKG
jgi:amidase